MFSGLKKSGQVGSLLRVILLSGLLGFTSMAAADVVVLTYTEGGVVKTLNIDAGSSDADKEKAAILIAEGKAGVKVRRDRKHDLSKIFAGIASKVSGDDKSKVEKALNDTKRAAGNAENHRDRGGKRGEKEEGKDKDGNTGGGGGGGGPVASGNQPDI